MIGGHRVPHTVAAEAAGRFEAAYGRTATSRCGRAPRALPG